MYGEDVITTADKINRPEPKREVQEIELFNEFNTRNPQADGGRMGFFGGKSVVSFADKIKELWLSGETIKKISTAIGLEGKKTTTIEGLINSMKNPKIKVLDGNKEISISKKELKTRPDIRGTTIGGKLPYAKDPVVSKKIIDAAKAGKDTIIGFLRKNPDLNKTSLYDFLRKTKTTWKSKGTGKPPFKKKITDDIIKVENFLKENPTVNLESIATGTDISLSKIGNIVAAYKKSFVEPRPNFIPDKSLKNFVNKINTNTPVGFEQLLNELLTKYGINPNKVSKETKNKLTKSRKAVSEFFEGGTNFEHTLPKSLIKYIDDPEKKIELLLTGSRTSPELNQFKKRYDNLLRGAVSRLKGTSKDKVKYTLKEYNDEVKRIRNEVKKATGGYEIGYLKFDTTGKATAVLPKGSKSLLKTKGGLGPETSQKLSAFENAKYHNNLIENYNKDPDSPIFNTLREYQPDPTKITLFKDQQTAYEQVNKYLKISKQKFLDFANKNINNPAVQAIFKSPYGKGATVTASFLIPSKLAAADGAQTTGFTTGEKLTGAGAAAGAYKFRKPIIKGAKAAGKLALKALTPLTIPLEGAFVLSDLKSGASVPEAISDVVLAGGIFRERDKRKFIKDKYGTETLNRYVAAKTPGITDYMDMPTALPALSEELQRIDTEADAYLQTLRNQRAQEFERKSNLPRPEINPFQAAGGGLANLTDTIPPESGPMSQGLRSLYNNDMDY